MSTNLLIVATCLILESGGEGRRGMEAVREVIHQRSAERHLTESAVCIQRRQFSCFNGVSWQDAVDKARRHPRWQLAVEIASGQPTTHWTAGANHYCTTRISPAWAKGRTPVAVIGNHKFYRL